MLNPPNYATFEVEGSNYLLRCNMNVLATVQAANGGNLTKALETVNGIESTLEFGAAMLSDFADERAENGDFSFRRYTPKQLGRVLGLQQVLELSNLIFPIIRDAVVAKEPEEEPSKN